MTSLIRSIPMFLLLFAVASGQVTTVRGMVTDSSTGDGIRDVSVSLQHRTDRQTTFRTTTSSNGGFFITGVKPGPYVLSLVHVAYDSVRLPTQVLSSPLNLGTLLMSEKSIPQQEVIVRGTPPPVEQIGDTTQFYADAFAVNKDANAEDLVAKMPGVTVEGTTVKSQGEDIRQVLVDGKQFFSDDPMIALRNLPAEVIERVQVYDKMSDQAELTGFDDGQAVRTMNIITRMNRRNGTFGKASGAYGTEAKYSGGVTTHIFNGDQRLSLFGISNNVNQQNFSMQDILGVMRNTTGGRGMFGGGRRPGAGGGRPGGGGGRGVGSIPDGAMMQRMGGAMGDFLVGEQNGLNATHSLGVTFGDTWSDNLQINGNYFLNRSDNRGIESLDRSYVASGDSAQAYTEENTSESQNTNHRFMLRMQYEIDSANTILVNPRFNAQINAAGDKTFGMNSLEGLLLNTSDVLSASENTGYNGSLSAIFRHKSDIPGRSVSAQARASFSDRTGSGELDATTLYPGSGTDPQTILSQRSSDTQNSSSLGANVVYTEPLMVNGLLQLKYDVSRSDGSSGRTTFSFDTLTGGFTLRQSDLSSDVSNQELSHRTGIGFRYGSQQGMRALVSLDYQHASLNADLRVPTAEHIEHVYDTFLPMATLSYRFPDQTSVQFLYRTSTQSPSATQLQSAVDNTNPVQLSTGNPTLDQSYAHTVTLRLGLPNPQAMTSFFATLFYTETRHAIVNSVLFATHDTTLPGGLFLQQGTQLSVPVNIDGQRTARAFLMYGFPVGFIGSNVNLNAGLTLSRTPALLNEATNFANTRTLSSGFSLVSTFSRDVDFTLSYTGNFTNTDNSILSTYNNRYYSHNAGFRTTIQFWEGIVIRTDATHRYYSGLDNTFKQDYVLWNASIGKKLFSDDQGELTFSVYDILRQNTNVSISTTDLYTETQTTNALRQYFLLTFSYTLRSFGGG